MWIQNRAAGAWSRLPGTIRALVGPLLVGVLAVGGLFFPGPAWLPALDDPAGASAFLGQLWQVVAATAGLTVAVVFFVYQGIAGTRPTAMRDAGVTGPFQWVVYLGVAALFIVGLVLLGIGHDAPGGWAAAWATCVTATSVAAVGLVFAVMLRAMDGSRLHRRRLKNIRGRATAYVEVEARLRIGLTLLDGLQEAGGFRLSVLGTSDYAPASISAGRAGTVTDINVRRLRAFASQVKDAGHPAPELHSYLGRRVAVGTNLLVWSPGVAGPPPKALARIVKVRRSSPERLELDLNKLASELHDEAIQAIRGAKLSAYDDVVEAQAELLLAIPETWKRDFGQQYSNELANGIFPLRLGPIDRTSRNIYEQVTSALAIEVREVALVAAYQPVHIATRAFDADAPGLVHEMMRASRSMVTIPGAGEVATLVRSHAWLNFVQFLQYSVGPVVEDVDVAEDRRRQAASTVIYGLELIAGIGKAAIDSRDSVLFEEVDRSWSHVHEFWMEEHAAEYRADSVDKDLATAIRDTRDEAKFVIACWLVHRLMANPDDSRLKSMFAKARLHFTNPGETVQLAARARTLERRELLSDWVMSDLPSGEVHFIDTTTPLLTATAVFLLACVVTDGQSLDPSPWLLSNEQALIQTIDSVASRVDIRPTLRPPSDDFAAIAEAAKRMVAEAAARQVELDESELIAAVITEEARQRFHDFVGEAWQRGRSMVALLTSAGGSRVVDDGEPPELRLAVQPTLQLKSWAIEDSDQPGFRQVAQHFGTALARGENASLIERLCPAAVAQGLEPETIDDALPDDLVLRVQVVVDQMRSEGYSPTLILHGRNWNLLQSLTVEPIDDGIFIDSRAKDVRGQRDGLIVAQTSLLNNDIILVVDARAWGGVREWTESAGQGLVATLTTYDPESARAFLDSHPDVLGGDLSEDERVRALQQQMLVHVSVSTEFEVRDTAAARVVPHRDVSTGGTPD